ncbi:MAG: hypothetical protein MK116_00635 [Phycisphaerales bacterium]|nr:hypothetical protein [Phycisphaerales bacterium]
MIVLVVFLAVGTPEEAAGPTWHGEIAAIVATHCGSCHRDDGPAPFTLQRYEDVAGRANFIEAVVRERLMPPWLPGSAGLPIRDHRGLPEDDIKAITDWVRAGKPIGTAGAEPATVKATAGAAPDLRLAMPEPWIMPAEGGENWGRRQRDKRTFVLPMNNAEALKVTALAYASEAPQAVHAVTFLADATGTARYTDDREVGPGHYMTGDVRDRPTGVMGGVGVGMRSLALPPGFHWEVEPWSEAVMEVHYRPTGREQHLRESLDLWFTDDPASRPVRTMVSMVRQVSVDAEETQRVHDTYTLPVDVDIIGFTPRATGVITSMNLNATWPDGASRVLLDIPDYDPHWRQAYLLEAPVRLPAGTRIGGSWVLENTLDNARNPFVPLERYVTGRRTGAVAILLHGAAADAAEDAQLRRWHSDLMMARQRPR